jgi:hypothetical protein
MFQREIQAINSNPTRNIFVYACENTVGLKYLMQTSKHTCHLSVVTPHFCVPIIYLFIACWPLYVVNVNFAAIL